MMANSLQFCCLSILAAAAFTYAQGPMYPNQHSHACLPPYNTFPFCDTSLPIPDRAADLVSRLTLSQKIANRYDREAEVDLLGLPDFNYNQEGLHGLGAMCFAANGSSTVRCPTIFPAPPALASSWNTTLLNAAGDVIGTEARAYNNNGGNRDYQNRPVDLVVWLPNINIARDPRWGRQTETYSEDPWLTGALGAAIVDGTQRGADGGASGNGYLKMIVAAKHATAYQIENDRFARNVDVTLHDLIDTFYPAWEAVVESGKAAGFMCAYPSINGVPACGNMLLETQLMRDTWGMGSEYQGGSYVQGDCGAIENIAGAHHFVENNTYGAAIAMNAGTDIDCGSGFTGNLQLAIELGFTTESALDASLIRTYTLQMLAGRFDPIENQPYMQIPFDAIDTQSSRDLALDAALQGMVLLRNDGSLLPLTPGGGIALIGPHGNSTGDLLGNYFAQRCEGGTFDCVPSLMAALLQANVGGTLSFVQACNITGDASPAGIASAVALAQASTTSVVILALGTNSEVAEEGNDAANMTLPVQQDALAAAVLAVGKPTVIVLFNGGTLSIDAIAGWGTAAPHARSTSGQRIAIVEAFFPGEAGGSPVAMHLYGSANRWGKLPATVYPAAYQDLIDITQFDMVAAPGRTYKYYTGQPLWPFGYGLSYTNFTLTGDCPAHPPSPVLLRRSLGSAAPLASTNISCSITVHNTGTLDGDEVVQVYVLPNATSMSRPLRVEPDPLAIRQLAAWSRVHLPAGGSVDVPFTIPITAFSSVDSQCGCRVVWPGQYTLAFTTSGQPWDESAIRTSVRIEVEGEGGRDAESILVRRYPSSQASLAT